MADFKVKSSGENDPDKKDKFNEKSIRLLKTLSTPVYLAGSWKRKLKLILYVAEKNSVKVLKQEIRKAKSRLNINISCTIKTFTSHRLAQKNSLNEFLELFDLDEIIWDPTNCINRAYSLVNCARDLRKIFDSKLKNILFEPRSRTLYIELNPDNYFDNDKVALPVLKNTEQDIINILKENMGDEKFFPSVRIGFEKPNISLIAIDDNSFEPAIIHKKSSLKFAFATVFMAAFWGCHSVMLYASELPVPYLKEKKEISSSNKPNGGKKDDKKTDLPAVSKTNFKTEISAGNVDGTGVFNFSGALAFPIRKRFGGQLELLGQNSDGDFMGGAGGHLFFRNPESSLFGLTAAYVGSDDYCYTRVGVESELYFDQFTFFAGSGYQFSNYNKDNPFYTVDLRWYVTDNFPLTIGSENFDGDWIHRLSYEYMLAFEALPGLTVFADGAIGNNDYNSVRFGFRYYFGDDKTLKRRHREDDPRNTLPLMMFNLQQDIKNNISASTPKPYG